MVQGLAFLSKKSWHTKNLNNQEKVWIAEEQAKQEQLKTAELQKQMQQEREEEELQQIAGGKERKIDRGIDWMYTGHDKNSAVAQEDAVKQAEEFLLGKAVPMASIQKGDIDAAANIQEGVNAVVKTVSHHHTTYSVEDDRKLPPSAPWEEEESVAKRNEAFRLRYEDPMYQVSLQTVRHEKQREQQKELYHKVGMEIVPQSKETNGPIAEDGDSYRANKRRRREERKSRKREKEDRITGRERKRSVHRSRKRSRRDSSRSGSDDSRSSTSSVRLRRRRHSAPRTEKEHRSRRRYSSSSSEEDRKRRRYYSSSEEDSRGRPSRNMHHKKRRPVDASPSHTMHSDRGGSDERRRGLDRRDSAKYRESDDERSYNRKSKDQKCEEGRNDHLRSDRPAQSSYGLQRSPTSAFSTTRNVTHTELGPDPELRRHKRQEKQMERQSIREHASQRRYQSTEDRARALRDMEDQAKSREATRWHSDRRATDDSSPRQGGALFVQEFSQKVHGIRASNGDVYHRDSMSARLQQNRNSHQRRHDDSFL